jgi:hypothetical protein
MNKIAFHLLCIKTKQMEDKDKDKLVAVYMVLLIVGYAAFLLAMLLE